MSSIQFLATRVVPGCCMYLPVSGSFTAEEFPYADVSSPAEGPPLAKGLLPSFVNTLLFEAIGLIEFHR